MSKKVDQLRQKLLKNPPRGMTAKEIRNMSDEAILDMDYFIRKVHDFKLEDDLGDELDDGYGHRSDREDDYSGEYGGGYDDGDEYDRYEDY